MVERFFALVRPARTSIPRTIERPRGGPITLNRPLAWSCFAVFDAAEIPNAMNDATKEWQLVAESALTDDEIRRYEAQAKEAERRMA
jgi:hypothetical protein